MLPWRNRLARTAVNREVPGSSPGGSVLFSHSEILFAPDLFQSVHFTVAFKIISF